MPRTGKPMGRPPKPEGEKFLKRMFTLPPDLWEEVEELIPERERSRVVQDAFRAEVERRKAEGTAGS